MTYIKVVGQVKIFSGKAHVVAHHVSKMQSLNELIAHSIECVHASMSIRKQGELVCSTSLYSIIEIGSLSIWIRMEQVWQRITIVLVLVKVNKHQQYPMGSPRFKMEF